MNAMAMAAVLGLFALVLVGTFLALWLRDRNRSEQVQHNPERLRTDPTHGPTHDPSHDPSHDR
jgi:Na+/glutamate symporter